MIFSVIVTFHPDLSNLNELIQKLMENEVTPIIVDNGSTHTPFFSYCKVINLKKNYGIAKAQNEGIKEAISSGATTIVFFDQDSTLTNNNFISSLYEPIVNGRAKITAPIFIDKEKGFTYPIVNFSKYGRRFKYYPKQNSSEFFVNHAISSGTMVDTATLIEIGYMMEPLFIDYVDTEWCLRANKLGYKILIVPKACMVHSIGDKTLKIFSLYVPKHSSFRRYYRVRNSLYLFRLPHVPKIISLREVIFSIIHQFILIYASKGERRGYIESLYRALRDGVKGKFG